MDPLRQQLVRELLIPLELYQSSGEYILQHQSTIDFYNCLEALEARYADLFERVLVLDKQLRNCAALS